MLAAEYAPAAISGLFWDTGEPYEGKIAVCRDGQGVVHACSAVCTHLGCDVAWNTAEQTWDCPCHGSRFSPDGTVINGPAVSDLRRIPVTTTR